MNELFRCQQTLEPASQAVDIPESRINWSAIDRWHTHPKFIQAVAHNITKALASFPEEERANVFILLSAHSQPMRAVNQGDAYSSEIAATVHAIMQHLRLRDPYRLCWQSKVGAQPWLGPPTIDVVQTYIDQGDPQLLLVPIAFTTDHIETLYELDQELIKESGHAATIKRAESLNDSPLFIEALAEIVKKHIDGGWKPSSQFVNRCLGCRKSECGSVREMFGGAR